MPADTVAALAHHPFHRRIPLPATAVSFDVEGRDQILLFWTPRAARSCAHSTSWAGTPNSPSPGPRTSELVVGR
ncbi:hypothetical protein JNW90_18730 [Micromonospora sp. STR1s_5]|nr:hypothetical protein [Micromonospora sp. STR1s_5]